MSMRFTNITPGQVQQDLLYKEPVELIQQTLAVKQQQYDKAQAAEDQMLQDINKMIPKLNRNSAFSEKLRSKYADLINNSTSRLQETGDAAQAMRDINSIRADLVRSASEGDISMINAINQKDKNASEILSEAKKSKDLNRINLQGAFNEQYNTRMNSANTLREMYNTAGDATALDTPEWMTVEGIQDHVKKFVIDEFTTGNSGIVGYNAEGKRVTNPSEIDSYQTIIHNKEVLSPGKIKTALAHMKDSGEGQTYFQHMASAIGAENTQSFYNNLVDQAVDYAVNNTKSTYSQHTGAIASAMGKKKIDQPEGTYSVTDNDLVKFTKADQEAMTEDYLNIAAKVRQLAIKNNSNGVDDLSAEDRAKYLGFKQMFTSIPDFNAREEAFVKNLYKDIGFHSDGSPGSKEKEAQIKDLAETYILSNAYGSTWDKMFDSENNPSAQEFRKKVGDILITNNAEDSIAKAIWDEKNYKGRRATTYSYDKFKEKLIKDEVAKGKTKEEVLQKIAHSEFQIKNLRSGKITDKLKESFGNYKNTIEKYASTLSGLSSKSKKADFYFDFNGSNDVVNNALGKDVKNTIDAGNKKVPIFFNTENSVDPFTGATNVVTKNNSSIRYSGGENDGEEIAPDQLVGVLLDNVSELDDFKKNIAKYNGDPLQYIMAHQGQVSVVDNDVPNRKNVRLSLSTEDYKKFGIHFQPTDGKTPIINFSINNRNLNNIDDSKLPEGAQKQAFSNIIHTVNNDVRNITSDFKMIEKAVDQEINQGLAKFKNGKIDGNWKKVTFNGLPAQIQMFVERDEYGNLQHRYNLKMKTKDGGEFKNNTPFKSLDILKANLIAAQR